MNIKILRTLLIIAGFSQFLGLTDVYAGTRPVFATEHKDKKCCRECFAKEASEWKNNHLARTPFDKEFVLEQCGESCFTKCT